MKFFEEILIGSKFDAKGFKQAQTATDKLGRGVKNLAKSFGLAFGTAQIVAFGKASVKAALDAQAQQQRLANLVKVTVGATDAQIQSLNDQAQALQEIGVVNKENITQTQSQLATFNLQIDTIKALTPAILDYVTAEKGAAASADEFKSMTNGLAQALNGNFASLTKVGFVLDDVTKKTIKNGTEAQRAAALVAVLDSTYKDFNKNLALTDAGQMQILANAADDAAENIGVGLIDALKTLGKDNSVENLANDMERASLGAADFIRGLAEITSFSVNGETKSLIGLLTTPFKRSLSAGPLGAIARMGVKTGEVKAADNAHLKSLQDQFKVIKKTNEISKKLTADELKKLKAKQLAAAIDKANLALNKGTDVFDLDKIQVAAALTNQAQQLGKATSAAQMLQIANDVARLNVKKSIADLEDAIASKDEAAIVKATAKLNEDLKILNALTGQKTQMAAIESILSGLKSKDLINQENLDQALAKIKKMLDDLANFKWPTAPTSSGGGGGGGGGGDSGFIQTNNGIRPTTPARSLLEINAATEALGGVVSVIGENGKEFTKLVDGLPPVFQMVEDAGAFNALVNSFAGGAIGSFNAGSFRDTEGGSIFSSGAVGSRDRDINVTINTGVGDPNAIAEAIDQVLIDAMQRGTLRAGAY